MSFKIAVLIPAYNEGKVLARSIRSVLDTGIPLDDVFVVDDGSKDDTAAIARESGANVLTIKNVGRALALQAGITQLRLAERYEYIAVMDADTSMATDYFDVMRVAIAKRPDACAFAGSPRSMKHSWVTAYRTLEYGISLGIYKEAQHLFRTITVCPGPSSVYNSSIFKYLEFSADTLAEDMDITIAMNRARCRLVYVPEAYVYTQDPPTIKAYVGQVKRWQRGVWQNIRKHRLGRKAQPIDFEFMFLVTEGLFFATMLALTPLWLYWRPYWFATAFFLDQLVLVSLAIIVAKREKRWDILLAFPLFTIPRVLNSFVFGWMFLAERRPKQVAWFTVERY